MLDSTVSQKIKIVKLILISVICLPNETKLEIKYLCHDDNQKKVKNLDPIVRIQRLDSGRPLLIASFFFGNWYEMLMVQVT